jgi:homocysteine S-methyltransferase
MAEPNTSHARRSFAERLAKAPLLFDGAMGTLLFSRGVPQRASLDELVASRPELIGAIHREYIDAGADVIETNSFGANRFRLAPFGLSDHAARLSRKAAQIAREARDVAGARDVLVAGSIGPLETPLHGPEEPGEDAIRSAFREQIEGLLEGGVDVLLFETFSNLDELLIGIREAQTLSDLPIVAQMTFGEDLIAVDGTSPQTAATALAQAGVDAIGVNCGVGPQICRDALLQMGRPSAGLARSIVPNAGLPQRVEGQFI